MAIWILTEEHNAYDQYGAYYVHAWTCKPTEAQLRKVLIETNPKGYDPSPELLSHIQGGGGRQKAEDHWYNLFEQGKKA